MTTAGAPPGTALERVRELLAEEAAAKAAADGVNEAGYLDLLEEDVESTGLTQDLMVTRLVPAIYERYWRPALSRVAKGLMGPGMEEEIRIARLLLGLGEGDVVLDHPQDGQPLCAATVDNVHGGREATRHLLALGHRRIAFLRGATMVSTIRQRREGAHLACEEAGLPPRLTIADVPLPPHSAKVDDADITHAILALRPRPTAVLCFNDAAVVGLLRGFRAAGIRVPADMSVVGYDDVYFASELSPPLTTVRQPTYDLGWAAAELLLAEARSVHRHEERVFRPQLIVRDSTVPPAT